MVIILTKIFLRSIRESRSYTSFTVYDVFRNHKKDETRICLTGYLFSAEQYVRQTRRTLMLDGLSDKCECTITDNDDGEIQFSCVLSQEGIVCRNYR